MGESISFVGLDVHANQTCVVALEQATGELKRARLHTAPSGVIEYLEALAPMRAVYESGPTGPGLARKAAAQGLDVRICTQGSARRQPNDRVKTDMRDAERLARLLAAGELRFARIPTVEEERFRDLVRAREDLRADLMRARHRLSKLLLRRELRDPRAGRAWSRDFMDWLRALRFDDEASKEVLRDYLGSVEAAHHCRHQPKVTEQLARRQRGVDPRVVAIAWRAQHRLHKRWTALRLERKKPAGVVSVAVARELAAFVWQAATLD